MKNIFLFTTVSLALIGCGGGGGDTSGSPVAPGIDPERGDTPMSMNELYSVSSGDQIIKTSSPTKLKITHIEGSRGSSVELIEGSAILRVK